jgi:hypothetical protein
LAVEIHQEPTKRGGAIGPSNVEIFENAREVRSELGKPSVPFVIGTTGMSYDTGTSPPPYENYHAAEKAQLR